MTVPPCDRPFSPLTPPTSRRPLQPIIPQNPIGRPNSSSEHYIASAKRLVTLETRLHPAGTPNSHSTASSSSPPPLVAQSALDQLDQYGSPSYSFRPSPTSLPSKAKRWIRGPARRAPPNTPTSSGSGWDDEVAEVGEGNRDGCESFREEEEQNEGTGECRDAGDLDRGWFSRSDPDLHTACLSITSSLATSSKCSAPFPTSPVSNTGSKLGISWEEDATACRTRPRSETSNYPLDSPKSDPIGIPPQATDTPGDNTALDHTLRDIGAELGEMSLGYEIRTFKRQT